MLLRSYFEFMYVKVSLALLVTVILVGTPTCSAYKGLFVMTGGTKGNVNFFKGIMEALTQNGHKITFVTTFTNKIEIDNVRQIVISEDYTDRILGNTFNLNILQLGQAFLNYVPKFCVNAFIQPDVQRVMKEDYDYIIMAIFFTECFMGYVYEKKVPLIYVTPNTLESHYSEMLGVPEFPSITPNKGMPFTYPLSFRQRVISAIGDFVMTTMMVLRERSTAKLSRELKLWSDEIPSIWELRKEGSIIIINSIRALEVPVKSTPPTVIYAGGIHIKPTKPLPQDLEDWLSGSGEPGFILFSLGTAIKSAHIKEEVNKKFRPILGFQFHNSPKIRRNFLFTLLDAKWEKYFGYDPLVTDYRRQNGFSFVMPDDMTTDYKPHLQDILNVFRSLDQRIIWKWDAEDIEDLPPNVRLSPWLPQRDILGHHKIRLFISHGGLLSTQEATYFEVPVIGMPVFGDQINNVARIVAEGWGRQITWKELTEEKFRNVVAETLTNNSLRQTVAHRSKLMKDWPTKPSEEVVYWTEYVIRHEGAKHLQSPLVHLTWYQIYNLDVWLVVTTVFIVIIVVSLLLIRMCCKFCVRKCFKRKTE